MPLIDTALHEIALQRTPGTFLFECVQAAAGLNGASTTDTYSTLEGLRRANLDLTSKVNHLQDSNNIAVQHAHQLDQSAVSTRRKLEQDNLELKTKLRHAQE